MVLLFALVGAGRLHRRRRHRGRVPGRHGAGRKRRDARERDLAHGIAELLVPFFLVGIGLHVDLARFPAASMLLLAAVILAAAVVSKFIGCGLGALAPGQARTRYASAWA